MAKISRLIVCDIDGVVADPGSRLDYLKNNEYDKFYGAEMAEDDWDEEMREVLRLLYKQDNDWGRSDILFLTGRPLRTLALTKLWLQNHITPFVLGEDDDDNYHLVGRVDDDHRKSEVVKPELLEKFLDRLIGEGLISDGAEIFLFDDDPENVVALENTLEKYRFKHKEFVIGKKRI